jgi:peptide/nickel transport system substrate-binding protein
MQGEKGGRGSSGSKGTVGPDKSLGSSRTGFGFSFTSLISFASFTSLSFLLFIFALTSCSRALPTEPGVVNFLIQTMPTNLDPRIGTDGASQRLDGLLFDSLVELDAQRVPQGDLAEKWEMPDARTYIFHLRSGVKFHDGRPLTSADVKYTFDSVLDGTVTSPKRGSLAIIQSIEAPDASTVIFHLREPFAGFLWLVPRETFGIVPAGTGALPGNGLIGTGPFRFVSAQQDDDVILERNDRYFGAAPKISRVRFRVVPEAIVRALELRKGSADVEVNSLTPDMIPVLRRQSTMDVTESRGTIFQYLAFNFEDGGLAKREVRQALAYATQREEIIRYLYRGEAQPADGPLPNTSWAYEPDLARYEYAPQKAEHLLDAAGFPRRPENSGMRLKLTMKITTEESARLLGAVLKEQWRKVGIDLELRPLEFATLFSDLARGNFEIYTLQWIGANNDADTFFRYIFDSRMIPPAGANRGHYRNPRIDALLDQARAESDQAKRREIFSEVQKIIAEDLPYVSLWFMDNVSVHSKRISGLQLSPTGDYDFLKSVEAK